MTRFLIPAFLACALALTGCDESTESEDDDTEESDDAPKKRSKKRKSDDDDDDGEAKPPKPAPAPAPVSLIVGSWREEIPGVGRADYHFLADGRFWAHVKGAPGTVIADVDGTMQGTYVESDTELVMTCTSTNLPPQLVKRGEVERTTKITLNAQELVYKDDKGEKTNLKRVSKTPAPPPGAEQPAIGGRPAPAPAPSDPDAPIKAFWARQVAACNAWNHKVGNTSGSQRHFDGSSNDPSRRITVIRRSSSGHTVEDADGNRFILDTARGVVRSPNGVMPIMYTSCPEKIFVGTTDDGQGQAPPPPPPPRPAPPPPPRARPVPAPAPGGLARDGLPHVIPTGTSKPPSVADWNAMTREVTVRGSSRLKCVTKMIREWLRVDCYRNHLGVPLFAKIVRQGGVQAFKFDRIGKQTSLVIQVVRGRSSEASFSWELGGSHAGASLYIKWPNGAPRPSMYFR